MTRWLKRLFKPGKFGARCLNCDGHNTEQMSWRWLKGGGRGWTDQNRRDGFDMWKCWDCGTLQNRDGLDRDSKPIKDGLSINIAPTIVTSQEFRQHMKEVQVSRRKQSAIRKGMGLIGPSTQQD
tara:strand:+ start:568 stop:939 length:372 start_codon:yes stop_codon:yes gene_type:complete